ncbi:MAG: MotA/TolQ/ExbB proton channel family protein [Deltaproteobacteria bacterium]|nr:MotA/TolQ/ExbB proton channel family protein [Deltaproteobacteria bacterium]
MPWPEALEDFLGFVHTGGAVMWPLFLTTFVMWALIIERYWYVLRLHPKNAKRIVEIWRDRPDKASWYAHQIRELLVSRAYFQLYGSTGIIRSLVAVCPLLGLLGTVMGMVEVFDVMATHGNGNVRAMASGVSEAIVTTMVGMVAALSGLYFVERLKRRADNERRRIEDLLTTS